LFCELNASLGISGSYIRKNFMLQEQTKIKEEYYKRVNKCIKKLLMDRINYRLNICLN